MEKLLLKTGFNNINDNSNNDYKLQASDDLFPDV